MGNGPLLIEFLFTPGCESAGRALRLLRRILWEEYGEVPVTVRVVADELTARRHHYRGSPTIRINGKDVKGPAPDPVERRACSRTYWPHQCRGVPDPDLIREALGGRNQSEGLRVEYP